MAEDEHLVFDLNPCVGDDDPGELALAIAELTASVKLVNVKLHRITGVPLDQEMTELDYASASASLSLALDGLYSVEELSNSCRLLFQARQIVEDSEEEDGHA